MSMNTNHSSIDTKIRKVPVHRLWNIWKYSLGSFSDDKTSPYDNYIASIRTLIFVSYMVTNAFIISGVVRHWNPTNNVSVDTQCIKK